MKRSSLLFWACLTGGCLWIVIAQRAMVAIEDRSSARDFALFLTSMALVALGLRFRKSREKIEKAAVQTMVDEEDQVLSRRIKAWVVSSVFSFVIFLQIFGPLVSIVILIGAIGLQFGKAWARTFSLVVTGITAVATPLSLLFGPGPAALAEQIEKQGLPQRVMAYLYVAGLLVFVWACIGAFLLSRPRAKALFK